MKNTYVENLIEAFKSNDKIDITKTLKLDDLLYKDSENVTLLEYMLMNNYEYHFSMVTGLKDNIEAIKLLCKYNKENILYAMSVSTLLSLVDENNTLIEYLIDSKKIDNMLFNNFVYNNDLINIFISKKRYNLIKKVNITENDLFLYDNKILNEIMENGAIDYIEFPDINKHLELFDLLVKYDKINLLDKIIFNDNLLLNDKKNPLIKRILDVGCYPKIDSCSFNILKYLYKINRGDALIKYFDREDNIFNLFKIIDDDKKISIIDYLLEFDKKEISLNFKEIGLSVYNKFDEVDMTNIYIKFSKYNKLDYLDSLKKEDLLKKNKKNHCVLDTFVFYDLEETFKILNHYNLDKDLDIVMYFKLNGIDIKTSDIDLDMFDSGEYSNQPIIEQNENIKSSVDYEDIGEENVYLLAELEEVLIPGSDRELVEAITLLYSKELAKGNDSVLVEINKLIEIKKSHPEFVITKSDFPFFNHNNGLHLSSSEINIISHELGHVFHYYLANDKTPFEFDELINRLYNDPKLLKRVEIFSNNMLGLEETINARIDKDYEKWSNEYYTNDKLDELKEFVECSKEDKIEKYIKLGYTRDELEVILDESYTLEQYMECHKRIECNERVYNIMSVSYSEVQAISDIIDAIYGGEYYNSKLKTIDGKTIKGTFGHGMMYYYSKDVIFQEIFANYCLLLKSDRKDESLRILKDIIGEDLLLLLDNFYNEELLNSPKYERSSMIL